MDGKPVRRKMHQENFRHGRDVDANGRVHLDFKEMAKLYRDFHSALNETYWNTIANQKICTDAMEILKTMQISNRNDRYLLLLTSIISEVYSHANYNIQKLLYDDRDAARLCYWKEILSLYEAIVSKFDNERIGYPENKSYQLMAILLHFASLYSLYKDVADEEFIISIRQQAEYYSVCDEHDETVSEIGTTKEFYEAIKTIYYLRNEHQRYKGEATKTYEPDDGPTLELTKEDLMGNTTDSVTSTDIPSPKHELNGNHVNAQTKNKILNLMLLRRQNTDGPEWPDDSKRANSTSDNFQDENKSVEIKNRVRKSSNNISSNPLVTEADLKEAIKNLNSSVSNPSNSSELSENSMAEKNSSNDNESVIVSSSSFADKRTTVVDGSSSESITTDCSNSLEHFDFKEEFERRFCRRKVSAGSVKLPVIIGKTQKSDIVRNYRRKGLFDDVEFRAPVSIHQMVSYHTDSVDAVVHRSSTIELNAEMNLVTEDEQNNNNVLKANSVDAEIKGS